MLQVVQPASETRMGEGMAQFMSSLKMVSSKHDDAEINLIIKSINRFFATNDFDALLKCRQESADIRKTRLDRVNLRSAVSILVFLYEDLDDLRAALVSDTSKSADVSAEVDLAIDQLSDIMTDITSALTVVPCDSMHEITLKARIIKNFIVDSEPDLANLLAKSLCDDLLRAKLKA